MNKKTILIGLALLLITGVLIFIFYWRSLQEISVVFTKNDNPVILYRVENDKQLKQATVTQSSVLRLQKGNYQLVSQNDLYDTSPVSFTVKDSSLQITFDPDLSAARLEKLLETEQGAITNILSQNYGDTLVNFTQSYGRLYKEGQWYATTLAKKASRSEEPDLYRIILKKEGGSWTIAARPSLSISIKEYPDIPESIIRAINKESTK